MLLPNFWFLSSFMWNLFILQKQCRFGVFWSFRSMYYNSCVSKIFDFYSTLCCFVFRKLSPFFFFFYCFIEEYCCTIWCNYMMLHRYIFTQKMKKKRIEENPNYSTIVWEMDLFGLEVTISLIIGILWRNESFDRDKLTFPRNIWAFVTFPGKNFFSSIFYQIINPVWM